MKLKVKIAVVLFSVAAVAAILFLGVFGVIKNNKTDFYKSQPLMLPDGFTVTAHTGCMDTKENSLEAIEKGVEFGADTVEFDLYFTADGTPVLSHDKPRGGEVTLDEAFKKVSEYENLTVNVDIKVCDALEKVAPLAEKYGILDRIFYTGVVVDFVQDVKSKSPQVKYFLNTDIKSENKHTEEYLQSLVELVKSNGAVGININKDNASKELVDYFHVNGLLVSIWTVSNEKDMHKILYFAPDNITTRNPELLNRIISEGETK